MKTLHWILPTGLLVLSATLMLYAAKTDGMTILTGKQAFSNTASLKPGVAHKITAKDLPKPGETPSGRSGGAGSRPPDAMPQAPAGFKVNIYAGEGLTNPRQIRTAPNGDYFVTDTSAGQIKIFRGMTADGKPQENSVFATGLNQPFGVNFYPNGATPQWLYVGNTNSLVRFPYKNGDLKATGPAETLIAELPSGGGHRTRDVVFSKDGKSMFVAVGSASNNDDNQAEFHRANILEYTPEGKFVGIYASGIRNPVGLAINPETGELWTSINERDTYGDNLVPDYVTHVERGGFYGWPWFYIGGNYDPKHEGKHPELKEKVIVPDVLVQPHSASLGMAFYDGKQFPKEYSGDAFAAEHGSWNHAAGSGHEVIRIPLEKGRASGVYQDFLTGFSTNGVVWGRPVGIAVARDGSLLVTDDGAKVIWRVAYTGK
ncbi:MAG TPA: sorbosone dehydrogenase family protein [Bryobacteraceae bacterium]|nr:sorbosone dehydrogenase family protein [Bryobacteraceae bacterium]